LEGYENMIDFTPIAKLEQLESLDVTSANISDISFLEKNKNIKELIFDRCKNIKDFTPISNLERLENLNISYTKIQIFHS